MSIEIKLVFASAHLASKALAAIAAADNVIDPLDNPAAGIEVTPPVPVASVQAAAMFPGAAVSAPFVQPGAAVAAPPTAPAAIIPPTPSVVLAPAAPSAPEAVAPTAPVAPPASAPVAVLRDSSGLPWDARIHAGTKTQKADGTWTARRGVDEITRNAVEAELRAAAGLPPAAATQPAVPPAPPAPPARAAQPPVPPVQPPAAPAGDLTFSGLMAKMAPAFGKNAAEATRISTDLLLPHGLVTVGQLAGRADLLASFDQQFFAEWDKVA